MPNLFKTPFGYHRRTTRTVYVGDVAIGSQHPIRLQSMITAEPTDVDAVLEEIQALAAAQCEVIRLTIPNQKAIDVLPEIRKRMAALGLQVPLVADIHFNAKLAVNVCEHVEKVRINPGNYVDKKRFEQREYTDSEYADELVRLEESLLPLIQNLKKYKRALRIGTNHGSLSDRIMNRFGDSPEGMVESALEFVRVFRKHDFHDIILSMKASNPLVMMQAYRMLVMQMEEEGMDYPLHLGVTEAGFGQDGRIKSAVGIGGLLLDGIGDTIRVSLTEPPEAEIPAARAIVDGVERFRAQSMMWENESYEISLQQTRRTSDSLLIKDHPVGGVNPVGFFTWASYRIDGLPADPFDAILRYSSNKDAESPEVIEYKDSPSLLKHLSHKSVLLLQESDLVRPGFMMFLKRLKTLDEPKLLLLQGKHLLFPIRKLTQLLAQADVSFPVGVVGPFAEDMEQASLHAAELGTLLSEKLIDVVLCPNSDSKSHTYSFYETLLQVTRIRLNRADFISCPSCGRTYFDLQTTTAAVQTKTEHLKGVKIAVMGCIVNGPGEMADADFGYVGSGSDKISLYYGKECVVRNIPAADAVDRLVDLIKEKGQWVEAS